MRSKGGPGSPGQRDLRLDPVDHPLDAEQGDGAVEERVGEIDAHPVVAQGLASGEEEAGAAAQVQHSLRAGVGQPQFDQPGDVPHAVALDVEVLAPAGVRHLDRERVVGVPVAGRHQTFAQQRPGPTPGHGGC